MARALLSSSLATLAPNTGARATTATLVSGRREIEPNCCLPLDLSRASMRRVGLPMTVKSLGAFKATVAGIGCRMAASASEP